MKSAQEILFEYLRDAIYDSANAQLDIESLPESFHDLGNGLLYFVECVTEAMKLAKMLAKGDLNGILPSQDNEIAAPLKTLHASLKHLTWQAQQIAQGDYQQRVGFLGDFSVAFNTMVEQLADRQKKLEDEISRYKQKTTALEQSNLLLSSMIHHVPQQIFVLDRKTDEILLMNDIAAHEINSDAGYIERLVQTLPACDGADSGNEFDVTYEHGGATRYFMVKTYQLEWDGSNAAVFAVSDVSATKNKMMELEETAYRDSATGLYNRAYGMLTLDAWRHDRKRFALIFADLDGLKYINDEFGHNEGDRYIMNAAKYLKGFSPDAAACRIGGDEFMLLVPEMSYQKAHEKMSALCRKFQEDEYLQGKPFSYSLSFGVVDVPKNNTLPVSELLSIADERMYIHKRMRKKARSQLNADAQSA